MARFSERQLRRLGLLGRPPREPIPDDVRVIDGWWVHEPVFDGRGSTGCAPRSTPPTSRIRWRPGLSRGAATDLLALPDPALLDTVVTAAGLESAGGQIGCPVTDTTSARPRRRSPSWRVGCGQRRSGRRRPTSWPR